MKCIVSELTIKFLILHEKYVNESDIAIGLYFPDWQCVDTLNEDVGSYLDDDYSIYDDYNGHRFDLNRKGFIKFVKIIPYMLIERIYTCP